MVLGLGFGLRVQGIWGAVKTDIDNAHAGILKLDTRVRWVLYSGSMGIICR